MAHLVKLMIQNINTIKFNKFFILNLYLTQKKPLKDLDLRGLTLQ